MPKYYIYGEVSFDVEKEIEAETKEEAIEKLKEEVKDFYSLNVSNHIHNPVSITFDMGGYKEETDD